MSLRLEMLQVARLAPSLLGEAAASVRAFLQQQFGSDGGACDRFGASDLYYTVFALDGLVALQADLTNAEVVPYLESFGAGDDLDLVHLACLARCRTAVGVDDSKVEAIVANLAGFRNADGGFAPEVGDESTVYHSFLGLGAYQDLGVECPDSPAIAVCVAARRAADGGYANQPGLPVGSTSVTAAAVTLLRYLGHDMTGEVADWLLARANADGGFHASPQAPLPDLLSTATAIHALAGVHVDLAPVQESCLDFVDSLWTGQAFCGHWADDAKDSEYTFYALLALGHLSL